MTEQMHKASLLQVDGDIKRKFTCKLLYKKYGTKKNRAPKENSESVVFGTSKPSTLAYKESKFVDGYQK